MPTSNVQTLQQVHGKTPRQYILLARDDEAEPTQTTLATLVVRHRGTAVCRPQGMVENHRNTRPRWTHSRARLS